MAASKPRIIVHFPLVTHGSQMPTDIVIHDTECGDLPEVQEISGVAGYWVRQGDGLGAQFIEDGDGNIGQGAPADQVTWAVAGHNTGKIHIELIGFASWTRIKWLSRRKQLSGLAQLIAYLSTRWHIPLHHSITNGVCMHRDFTDGTHTDPGPHFPFLFVLRSARRIKHGGK